YLVDALLGKECLHLRLARQIQLRMGTCQDLAAASLLEMAHYGRTHHATMAGDIESRSRTFASVHRHARRSLMKVVGVVTVPPDQFVALRALEILAHHLGDQFGERYPRRPAEL